MVHFVYPKNQISSSWWELEIQIKPCEKESQTHLFGRVQWFLGWEVTYPLQLPALWSRWWFSELPVWWDMLVSSLEGKDQHYPINFRDFFVEHVMRFQLFIHRCWNTRPSKKNVEVFVLYLKFCMASYKGKLEAKVKKIWMFQSSNKIPSNGPPGKVLELLDTQV